MSTDKNVKQIVCDNCNEESDSIKIYEGNNNCRIFEAFCIVGRCTFPEIISIKLCENCATIYQDTADAFLKCTEVVTELLGAIEYKKTDGTAEKKEEDNNDDDEGSNDDKV